MFQGHNASVEIVTFSPSGTKVLTGSDDASAVIWDAARRRKEIRRFKSYSGSVNSVAFSRNGRRVLTGTSGGYAFLWNESNGKQLRRFAIGYSDLAGGWSTKSIEAAIFSPDDKSMLAGDAVGNSQLWDLTTGEVVKEFGFHGFREPHHTVFSLAFSPNGAQMLAGDEGRAYLWDVARERVVTTLDCGRLVSSRWILPDVRSVVFSPSGRWALTGNSSGVAQLWRLANRQCVGTFECRGHVNSVKFSPDERYVLIGSGVYQTSRESASGEASLWELSKRFWGVRAGRRLCSFAGHGGPVTSVAFSPSGRQVLTGSSDKTARLWNVPNLYE